MDDYPFENVALSSKSANIGNNAVADYSCLLTHTVNSDVCCRMISCNKSSVKVVGDVFDCSKVVAAAILELWHTHSLMSILARTLSLGLKLPNSQRCLSCRRKAGRQSCSNLVPFHHASSNGGPRGSLESTQHRGP